jgi:hypothetical protein
MVGSGLPVEWFATYLIVENMKVSLHNNVIISCFRMCNWSLKQGVGQRIDLPSHLFLEVLLAVRRLEKPPYLHTSRPVALSPAHPYDFVEAAELRFAAFSVWLFNHERRGALFGYAPAEPELLWWT